MGMPVYVRELPRTEIEGGHVTAAIGDMEFVATVALYRSFIEREHAKLAEWDNRARSEGAAVMRIRDGGTH